jgi:hypothetical protein
LYSSVSSLRERVWRVAKSIAFIVVVLSFAGRTGVVSCSYSRPSEVKGNYFSSKKFPPPAGSLAGHTTDNDQMDEARSPTPCFSSGTSGDSPVD